MRVAMTGTTGFLGRYIARELIQQGHLLRCWRRPGSDRGGFEQFASSMEWVPGDLADSAGFEPFCRGTDAVVHAALYRPPGAGFRAAADAAFEEFLRVNLFGSLKLMSAARRLGVPRFVYISTCAVHEVILADRPLDEAHPLWPTSHYGAHKAAVEKFVHSFGLGGGWPVCALRPCGIYGLGHPPDKSKWFEVVRTVVAGRPFASDRGGKEVHAADVAGAVSLLMTAPADKITGQSFNCCDLYVSEKHVAELARELSGSNAEITGENRGPKNQIDTGKIRALGLTFGGEPLLRRTIGEMVESIK